MFCEFLYVANDSDTICEESNNWSYVHDNNYNRELKG